MSIETDALLQAGQAALGNAEWQAARRAFEQALEIESSPQAHDGLGLALWWQNDIRASHHHRTLAYQQYKKRNELARAALIAVWLGREQVFLSGNFNALKGWCGRAERLLAETGPCVEREWYRLLRASMLSSAQELEETAEETLGKARTYGDDDLEALSLAFGGIARVSERKVASGMQYLDEAMTAALSGEIELIWVSEIFCLMLSACDLVGDLGRTDRWVQTAREYAERNHFPFLAATCRVTFGGLLTALGRWGDAEQELSQAIAMFQAGHTHLRAQAVIKLADLYVWQGRLEEAEALLSGFEDMVSAALPLARLALLRGDPALASAIVTQGLGPEDALTLDKAPLLRLLVDVELTADRIEQAEQAVGWLEALAKDSGSELLLAQAELAQGQIRRTRGDADAATFIESALKRLHAYDQSLLAARARFEMALLTRSNDRPASITWARAALASFARMGAKIDADRATNFLRQLGVHTALQASAAGELTAREIEVLDLLGKGLTNRQIGERLVVSPKTVEHHVSQILSKLGARSRAEAAAIAVRREYRPK